MKKLKGIDGKLDEAWSKLVKLKAGWKLIWNYQSILNLGRIIFLIS